MNMQVNRTAADNALQNAERTPDFDKLKGLGQRLYQQFFEYERDRRLIELKWARNARQYLGIYDPEVESQLDKNQSRAYPKLTRVKCVSMLSRLMNLLFPSSDKNWTITNTPIPNLDAEDLAAVLTALEAGATGELTDKAIELAIVEFAKERSRNLERTIEDQLLELGGTRQLDYVQLCRKVLMSGITYGVGVLKGPFAVTQPQRTWTRDEQGRLVPQSTDAYRPQYEFVNIWDYYPDLTAKYFHQMDGQFQRIVMSRHQLRDLADRPDFFKDQITQYLRDHPKGNYRRRTFESEVKAMGPQNNVNDQDGRKYEVYVWDGYISGHELSYAGIPVSDDKLADQTEAIVWILDGVVIKCDMNPWVQLDVGMKVNTYHQFVFEEDESSLVGNGLPNIMRDSQMSIANAARMLMDNAGIVSGPSLEINTRVLTPGQDVSSITPYKRWFRDDDDPATMSFPAVRNVGMDGHIKELLSVIDTFRTFADTETFVNAATGGDMQAGPSEPFRTAAGASMLRGDAALPFKDVVRNFDVFTQSVISSAVAFNMQFNPDPTIRGDHQVIARGATSLMAKEVRGITLDSLSTTLTPEEKRYINMYDLLRERLLTRDIDLLSGVICDKDEAARRDQQAASADQAKQDQTDSLIRAEIRKALADSVKSLTQADKNSALADSATAKTMAEATNSTLGTLENGVNGDEQRSPAKSAAGAGDTQSGVPDQNGGSGAGAG